MYVLKWKLVKSVRDYKPQFAIPFLTKIKKEKFCEVLVSSPMTVKFLGIVLTETKNVKFEENPCNSIQYEHLQKLNESLPILKK